MLSYEEFQVELMKALEKRYPDVKIVRQSRFKFNEIKQGIVIETQGNIQPIVYPDNLYEGYQRVEDMELVLESIDLAIEYDKMNKFNDIVKDWEQARQYIFPYIANLEKNQLCMDCHDYVYKKKLDFAYGVYVELPDEEGCACVTITNKLLQLWDVSETEVFDVAEFNAKYSVRPMREVIKELMAGQDYEYDETEEERMYVLTSERKHRGAAGMFDMGLLKRTAEELKSDFFILPCSMHEVILVPVSSGPSKEFLREAVTDVNHCQQTEEDYLSDNVYYYDRKEQTVDIVEFD